MLHEFAELNFRVVDQCQAAADDLAEIVRRNVRRHTDRDTRRAIDEQVGDTGGHDRRLALGAIVVLDEIDRFLVDVGKQLVGDAGHAHFGVTHGGRTIAVDRAEVALPVDQQVTHGERLSHAHDRVVDRRITVRVVFTDDVTNDPCRFLVGLVVIVPQLAHRVQHASVHGFESIPDIGQGATHDDAHRVVQIGLLHLLFEAY